MAGNYVLDQELFGPLWSYLDRESVTDLDYNGKSLWVTDLEQGRFMIDNLQLVQDGLTATFFDQFVQRIANLVSRQFNKRNPVLEAETPGLRLTILHESVARTGRCISVRKTPPILRLTTEKAIHSAYAEREVLAFLANCVKAKMTIVFCGLPGAGKTESLKFFASLIPEQDRVITIEDTLEIHYSSIHPSADAVEMKVSEDMFTYTDAIKASLRLNPTWLMLSEARSQEVRYLLESWSTGVHGMTTIHTSDVRNIPDRIMNMLGSRDDADRLENDIYQTLDLAVLVRREGNRRFIDQIGIYQRRQGKNIMTLAMFDRKWILSELPEEIMKRLMEAGVEYPFLHEKISEIIYEEKEAP